MKKGGKLDLVSCEAGGDKPQVSPYLLLSVICLCLGCLLSKQQAMHILGTGLLIGTTHGSTCRKEKKILVEKYPQL